MIMVKRGFVINACVEMTMTLHVYVIAVGIACGITLPIIMFTSRKRSFDGWAKTAAIIVSFVAVAWGTLGHALIFYHSSMSHDGYLTATRIKSLLRGIAVGLLLAILMSQWPCRLHHKPDEDTTSV